MRRSEIVNPCICWLFKWRRGEGFPYAPSGGNEVHTKGRASPAVVELPKVAGSGRLGRVANQRPRARGKRQWPRTPRQKPWSAPSGRDKSAKSGYRGAKRLIHRPGRGLSPRKRRVRFYEGVIAHGFSFHFGFRNSIPHIRGYEPARRGDKSCDHVRGRPSLGLRSLCPTAVSASIISRFGLRWRIRLKPSSEYSNFFITIFPMHRLRHLACPSTDGVYPHVHAIGWRGRFGIYLEAMVIHTDDHYLTHLYLLWPDCPLCRGLLIAFTRQGCLVTDF